MECPTTETVPQLCVSFRAGPSLNVGSTVATAASFRPSATFCVTNVRNRAKLLKPLAQTVAQSSRGQRQEMGTCYTKSARRRGKDRQAATENKKQKRNKDEIYTLKNIRSLERVEGTAQLAFGTEIPGIGEKSVNSSAAHRFTSTFGNHIILYDGLFRSILDAKLRSRV